jgi:hypothetical protein
MLEEHCPGSRPPIDGRSRFFHPSTKCCTFHPRLPNDLVGGILEVLLELYRHRVLAPPPG